jgi:hypothetical protein
MRVSLGAFPLLFPDVRMVERDSVIDKKSS